jgi:hypothetical protein
MKPAVFEISEGDGQSRLICVLLKNLQEAVEIEKALRAQLPRMHVRLLGRFECVEIATSLEDFMDLATSADFACTGGFEGRMRRLIRE